MKRFVIILVIILVLVGAGGLVFYIHRRNSGGRLLARAQLALRSKDYDKAARLAGDYVEDNPDRWMGYHTQARAYILQGAFEQAREVLQRGLEVSPDNVTMQIALADTYAIPGRKMIDTAIQTAHRQTGAVVNVEEIETAMEQIRDSLDRLAKVETTDEKGRLDRLEAVAREKWQLSLGHRLLALRYGNDADMAQAGGLADKAAEARRQGEHAETERARLSHETLESLLRIVQADPNRRAIIERVVDLGVSENDRETIAAVAKILADLDPDKTPAAAAGQVIMFQLAHRVSSLPDAQRDQQVRAAAESLDELIAQHPDETELKMQRARLAWDQDHHEKARQLCETILNANAEHREAMHMLGRYHLRQGDAQQAFTLLQKLKDLAPGWADARYSYAMAALRTGNQDRAVAAMRRLVDQIDPAHVGARRFLAAYALQQGDPVQAVSDASALFDKRPKSPDALMLLVEMAVRTGQEETAAAAADEVAATEPTDTRMRLALGDAYRLIGRGEQARQWYTRAAESQPESLSDRLAVAEALIRLGRTARAETLLREQLEQDPQNAAVHHALGTLYLQGSRMQAIEHYRKAVELAGYEQKYRMALARALHQVGNLDGALAELRHVPPGNLDAARLKLKIRLAKGEDIDTLSADASDEAGTLQLAGDYLRNLRPDKARDLCRQLLTDDEDNQVARALLARSYLMLNEPEQAARVYEEMIAREPESPGAYVSLAQLTALLTEAPEPDGGQDVRDRLASVPGARLHLVDSARARLALQRGAPARAEEILRKIVQTRSAGEAGTLRARSLLVESLLAQRKLPEALTELETLAGHDVTRTTALLRKAQLLAMIDRQADAVATCREILDQARRKDAAGALDEVARMAGALGQRDLAFEAVELYEKLVPHETAPMLLRSEIHAGFGEAAQAVDALRRAIERQPGGTGIYLRLARLHESRGQFAEAMAVLEEMQQTGQAGRLAGLFEQGQMFGRWGLQNQAAQVLRTAAEQATEEAGPRLHWALARAFAAIGAPDPAREALAKIPSYSELYPVSRELLSRLAETPERRLEILRELVSQRPRTPGAHVLLIEGLIAQEDLADAAEAFEALRAMLGPRPLPRNAGEMGLYVYSRTGQKDKLLALAKSQMNVDYSREVDWRLIAVLLTMEDDPQDAARLLPLIEHAGPADTLLGLLCAYRRGEQRELSQWHQRYRTMLQRRPSRTQQLTALRVAGLLSAGVAGDKEAVQSELAEYEPRGLIDSAVVGELASRLEQDPDAARAEMADLLAAALAVQTRLGPMAWDRAMAILRDRPGCQLAAALAAAAETDAEKRQGVLDALAAKDSALALRLRAAILGDQGKHVEAAEHYARAAEHDAATDADATRRAMELESAGRLDQALTVYLRQWQRDQDRNAGNNAANIVATLYADSPDRLREALGWMEQIVAQSPRDPAFRDTRGWLHVLLGNHQAGLDDLRFAVQRLPEFAQVHYHLARAEQAAGNAKFARWHYQAAVDAVERRRREGGDVSRPEADAAQAARQALESLRDVEA